MAVSQLYASLGLDTKDFTSGLKKAGTSLDMFAANAAKKVTGLNGQTINTKLTPAIKGASTAMQGFTAQAAKMGNVFTGGLGIGVLAGGLASLVAMFTRGIEKAQEFETGVLSIAAAQQSAYEWITKTGKAITGQDSFLVSLTQSWKINDRLIERASKNILTYQEQLAAFRTGVPYLSRMTNDWQKQVGLTERLAVASKVLGQSGQQVAQQVRAILGGANVQKSVLGSALGLTNADVKKWKQAGTLIEELEKRLTGFEAGASFFENSIEGIRAQFENTIDLFLADLGKGFVRGSQGALKDFQKFLTGGGGKQLGATLSKLFENILKGVQAIAQSPAIPILMKFFEFLANNADKIIVISVWLKLASVLKTIAQSAALAGLNFKKMGANATSAVSSAAAATSLANASGTVARGPNAPNRMSSAAAGASQAELPLIYTNKAGRRIDPDTGKFLPNRPSSGAYDLPIGSGQGSLFDLDTSAQAFDAIQQGNKKIAKGLIGKWKQDFSKIGTQLQGMNSDALLGRAGLAFFASEAIAMGNDWLKKNLGELGKKYEKQLDLTSSVLQGAVSGALIGSVIPGVGTAVGALVGAVAALGTSLASGINGVIDQLDEGRKKIEAETQEMLEKNPVVGAIMGKKDQIARLNDLVAYAENPSQAFKDNIAKRKAVLEEEIKNLRIAGTATAKVRKATDDFQKGAEAAVKAWDGALKVLTLMTDTLKKTLSTKLAETVKKINEIKLLTDDEVSTMQRPGESGIDTRKRLMGEVGNAGIEELNRASREAARNFVDSGINVRNASINVDQAFGNLERFMVNLPAEQAQARGAVLTANQTYLNSLTSTSQSVSTLRSAIDERSRAEAEAAALSRQYGLNQQDVLSTFYGDTKSVKDVVKEFTDQAQVNLEKVTAQYLNGQASLVDLNKAQDRVRVTESAGFQKYLKDSENNAKATSANAIQQASANLVTAQYDYTANLKNLSVQSVQLNDAITQSTLNLQRANEEAQIVQVQFAEMSKAAASAAASINKLIAQSMTDGIKNTWNFNIQVDNVMKELIDPAKLEAAVQKEIKSYVANACRGSNR